MPSTITQNMEYKGNQKDRRVLPVKSKEAGYDKMLQRIYENLDQNIFKNR